MVTCGLMVDLDFGLSVLDSDSDTEVDFRVLGQNRRLKCWYFNLQFMFERLQSIVEEDGGRGSRCCSSFCPRLWRDSADRGG